MGIIDCPGYKWCIMECPVGAIYVASVNDYYKNILIRDDECICCGACKSVCPTQAIYLGLPPECRRSGGGVPIGGGGGGGGGIGSGGTGGGDDNDEKIREIGKWAGEELVAMTLGEQIAERAKQQLINNNRRYGSGADSLVDCSKLTQEIAAQLDIKLPRTAKEQMQWFKDKNKTVNRNNPGCIKFNSIDSIGQIHNISGSTTGFPNKYAGHGRY